MLTSRLAQLRKRYTGFHALPLLLYLPYAASIRALMSILYEPRVPIFVRQSRPLICTCCFSMLFLPRYEAELLQIDVDDSAALNCRVSRIVRGSGVIYDSSAGLIRGLTCHEYCCPKHNFRPAAIIEKLHHQDQSVNCLALVVDRLYG